MTQREIIGKTPHTMRLLLAIALAIIMIAGGFVVLASSQPTATSPPATAAATTASILPNPTLNTNVTWSTFYNGWNPLEYSNGSANLTLNAQEDSAYPNPVSISLQDIQSPQLQGAVKGIGAFDNTSAWQEAMTFNNGNDAGGGFASWQTISNSSGYLKLTTNSSTTSSDGLGAQINVPISDMPSANGQFDYITMIYGATGQQVTGLYINNMIQNQTNDGTFIHQPETSTSLGTFYQSISIAQLKEDFTSSVTEIQIGIGLVLPKVTTASDYTLDLYGLAITTEPLTLGAASTPNGTIIPTTANNTAKLSTYSPDFAWSKIPSGGYTVAVSQPLQNTTITQTAINSNGYSEQVTYQGIENLPSAPDLSYGATNISLPMSISGKQYTIANLNGISYLAQINAKSNGTFNFGTVNPNQQNSVILQVDYTTAQWNSVSGAPPFFSLAGLEYYWWVGLIGFFSLIGLGSAALAHWGGAEENLRTPKGKFGR